MLMKERVKLLKLEIKELREQFDDIDQVAHSAYLGVNKSYDHSEYVDRKVTKLEEVVKGVIDAVNNQHKSLREQKSELETKYVKAVSALKFLLISSSSGDVFTLQGLSTYLMKVLGEINE
jgi:hypothetical protein